ncbi:hypothetical protein GCM10010384_48040 [Streptomyces djakartensis]|uniref:Uncharacterized protein n=1 Tax=Streptomyces djakartensis TaxID=68193 RepID=A0ABQ3A7R5_9ACTN|nr:hypothetical protein GCM10010384_48040 [Streptomyces djakartensis]
MDGPSPVGTVRLPRHSAAMPGLPCVHGRRQVIEQVLGHRLLPGHVRASRPWPAAYRAFGTDPRRIRPSVDALGRRMAKKGTLPRINPAVGASRPGVLDGVGFAKIVYTDTTDVLTRHWNHRDAHRTRVTEDSAHVPFVLETVDCLTPPP